MNSQSYNTIDNTLIANNTNFTGSIIDGNCSTFLYYQSLSFKCIRIITSVIGMIGGAILFAILLYGRSLVVESSVTFILMIAHTILDLFACIVYFFTLLIPLSSTNRLTNIFLCKFWRSGFIFNVLVNSNIGIKFMTVADRYVAVIHSMYYFKRKFGKEKALLTIALCILNGLIHAISDTWTTSYKNSTHKHNDLISLTTLYRNTGDKYSLLECTFNLEFEHDIPSLNALNGLRKIDAFLYFIYCYLVPSVAMIYLYAQIIFSLKIASDTNKTTKSVQQTAAGELNKIFIINTVMFVLCFAVHSVNYFISEVRTDLGAYTITYLIPCNIHQLGIYFILLLSCCNPFITLFMRTTYRAQMWSAITHPLAKMGFRVDTGSFSSHRMSVRRPSIFGRSSQSEVISEQSDCKKMASLRKRISMRENSLGRSSASSQQVLQTESTSGIIKEKE